MANNTPPQTAPDRAFVSNAHAGNPADVPPFNPAPPERAQPQQPDPNFKATAFEAGGSAPGIRAQYEASAAAYRQAAAQSSGAQRDQYLQAADQLDRQAAALGTQ